MSTTPETIIVQAFADANLHPQAPDAIARQVINALEAAGYTIKAKPKPRAAKAAEPVEVFAPDTGNPDLDDFMRRHHSPDWRAKLKKALARTRPGMMNMPTPPPGHSHSPLTQQKRADLYREHNVIQHSA